MSIHQWIQTALLVQRVPPRSGLFVLGVLVAAGPLAADRWWANADQQLSSASPSVPSSAAGPICDSRPGPSRWLPVGEASYQRSHEYGREADDWLHVVKDVVVDDGLAWLFDAGRGRVVTLDAEDLSPVRTFGRIGEGPGEIARDASVPAMMSYYWTVRFIGANAGLVVLYDRQELQLHTDEGELLWQRPWPDDSNMFRWGVQNVDLFDDGTVLVMADSVDASDRGVRPLRVLGVTGPDEDPVLFGERLVRLPWPPPRSRGAVPSMSSHGPCVVTTDGAESYLHLLNVRTGAVDSLGMPPFEVPALGDDEGVVIPGVSRRDPARGNDPVPIRWIHLIVDPDGTIWVRKWTPYGSGIVDVAAVDIDDGSVAEFSLPAFPWAFAGPGAYLAVETDPETDELLSTRYTLSR